MKKILLTLGLILLAPLAIAGHHVNGTWSMDVDLGGHSSSVFGIGDGATTGRRRLTVWARPQLECDPDHVVTCVLHERGRD